MAYTFDVDKWMKERKEKRYQGANSLHGFKEFMLGKGFKYLVIHFDGCGDSGECYEMEGYKSMKSFNDRDFGSEYISFRDWSNKDANGDPTVIP